MKLVIVILTVLFSQLALANNAANSELMVKTLEEAGVKSWGRKQNLQASITCKINRHKNFQCVLTASGLFDGDDSVYKIYEGSEATKMSELLKSFEVYPYGRRNVQEASMLCRLSKGSNVRTCADQSFDSPVN